MYHVYMRNLGDIFEMIPISVSTLYKVSCLFNPTTESSPSFCFFWTPGSSTALVKEFQGFSIRATSHLKTTATHAREEPT